MNQTGGKSGGKRAFLSTNNLGSSTLRQYYYIDKE